MSQISNMHNQGPWYLICENNRLYKLWRGISTICCLLSSYYYGYMAAFEAPSWGERNFTIMLVFEFIFFLSIKFKFLREFTKEGQTVPTRDMKQIAERYIRDDFIYDLIPIIPFPLILELDGGRQSHMYIIKCMRVVNGFRVFDVNVIMQEIRKFQKRRL